MFAFVGGFAVFVASSGIDYIRVTAWLMIT